jgi:hypothetical protein
LGRFAVNSLNPTPRRATPCYAKDRDVSTMNLQTLRGDLSPGSITRYDDYLNPLPVRYRDYAPRLDL